MRLLQGGVDMRDGADTLLIEAGGEQAGIAKIASQP